MKRLLQIILLMSFMNGQAITSRSFEIPRDLDQFKKMTSSDTSQTGLVSNVISEIKLQGDSSWVWLGTGKGLSRVKDSVNVETVVHQLAVIFLLVAFLLLP